MIHISCPPLSRVSDKAVKYVRENMTEERRCDEILIAKAAKHARCSVETVRDWLRKEGIIN